MKVMLGVIQEVIKIVQGIYLWSAGGKIGLSKVNDFRLYLEIFLE